MYNPPTERYPSSTQSNAYCPSVPISVYRELAAELQSAQAMVDSLSTQNQQLLKQNQQLRQEVEKVLQAAQHLEEVVAAFTPLTGVESRRRPSVRQPEPRPAANVPVVEFPPPPQQKSEPASAPYRETLVIEQEDTRSRRTSSSSEGLSDVNGWFLIVAIVLIVLTAFGTGFLIVRPLLNNNR